MYTSEAEPWEVSSHPCFLTFLWGHTPAHLSLSILVSLFPYQLCQRVPFMSLDLWLLRGAVDEKYNLSFCPILGKVFIRRLLRHLERRRCIKEEIE